MLNLQLLKTMLNFFLNIVLMVAVFALIFLVRKPNLEKKIQFIQTNSFIIFTYPNPVLLVPCFGGLVRRLYVC